MVRGNSPGDGVDDLSGCDTRRCLVIAVAG